MTSKKIPKWVQEITDILGEETPEVRVIYAPFYKKMDVVLWGYPIMGTTKETLVSTQHILEWVKLNIKKYPNEGSFVKLMKRVREREAEASVVERLERIPVSPSIKEGV